MKHLLFFCLLFLLYDLSGQKIYDFSQKEDQEFKSILKTKESEPNVFCTMDAAYSNSRLFGRQLHGFQFSWNFIFEDLWMTGIYYQSFSNYDLRLNRPLPVEVINPRYTYFFVGLNNGIVLFPRAPVSLTIPLRIGLGGVTLKETYVTCNDCGEQRIDQDYFFLFEPGLDMQLNLTPNFSLFGSGGYRIPAGVDRAGTNEDFNQWVFSAGLRFRFY